MADWTDWIGDILQVGGSVASAAGKNSANVEANQKNIEAQDRDRRERLDFISGGSKNAYGDIIDRRNPATGSFETTLSPGSQALAEAIRSKNTTTEGGLGSLATAGSNSVKQFNDSGFTAAGGRSDFSKDDAMAIIDKDNNRIRDSILDPALNKASMLDARRKGNTSNAGNLTSNFMKEILPQIQLGGEREAMSLKSTKDDEFIKNSLGIGTDALKTASGGQQVTTPGVANLGTLSNATNAIPKPGTVTPDYSDGVAGSGVNALGQAITARQAEQKNDANTQRILDILSRQQGNQTNGPVAMPWKNPDQPTIDSDWLKSIGVG